MTGYTFLGVSTFFAGSTFLGGSIFIGGSIFFEASYFFYTGYVFDIYFFGNYFFSGISYFLGKAGFYYFTGLDRGSSTFSGLEGILATGSSLTGFSYIFDFLVVSGCLSGYYFGGGLVFLFCAASGYF